MHTYCVKFTVSCSPIASFFFFLFFFLCIYKVNFHICISHHIPMLVLPTEWITKSLPILGNNHQCIYGFISNVQIDCSYGFYLTNFEHVWVQELDKQGITTAASSIGLEDLTDSTLIHLLNELKKDIRNNIQFEQKNGHIIAQADGQPQWKFSLLQQDHSRTIQFLAKLNYQQFANMSYLKFQVDNLKEIISVKDQYARFLATNFKQSHGMELIDNYKRNNRSESESIEKFNPHRWNKKCAIDYRHLRSSKKISNEDELKKNISLAVEEPWKFANLFYLNVTEEQENLSPVKFKVDNSQSSSASQSQLSQIQFESQPTLDLEFLGSPTKRQSSELRLPIVSQTNSSSSQNTSQSQRKRRKIGALSKR